MSGWAICICNSAMIGVLLRLINWRVDTPTPPPLPPNCNGHSKDVRMSMRTAALRIGLLTASSIFCYVGRAVWTIGQSGTAPLNLGLSAIPWLCGIFSAALALLPSVSSRVAWLVLVSFIVLAFQTAYFTSQNYSPQTVIHSDNEMIGKFALEALKHGQNPYEWNFSDSPRVYRDIGLNLTPFLDGSYQYRLTYPALPLLVLWTFDRIGLGQVRIVNFVFLLVLVILIFLGTPEKLRPLSLLPLLVLNSFTGLALSGAQDVVWCALLVCMILVWKRPLLRAILFGLAAAFHQQPWLVAPFLLIVLWHGGGTLWQRLRRIGYFVGISLGIFFLIKLPFIAMDYRACVLGAFEPAYAAFNMFSHGLGIVSMYGILHLPREFYTALQVAFYAVAIFVQWRHPRAVGPMFWLFPAIFFWLFYRGLINYWVFWIPPLLVAMARAEYVHLPALVSHRGRVTAGVSLVMLTLPTALGVYYRTWRPLLTATLELQIVTSYGGGLSDKLSVTVTNSDDRAFRPRFAVQRDPGGQALPWSILSGPDSIAPSTTVEYVIGNNNNYLTAASTSESAQVVVSDGDGSYQRRALVTD